MEPSDPLDSQWISIHIRDRLEDRDINIRDSLVTPGDFHSPDDPTKSLTESTIDKMVIPSNGLGEVCATGRRGSEGWLDLFDGDKKICELHWDNRSEQYMNDFEVLDGDEEYKVECSGWSSAKGPLGHVFVDVSKAERTGKGNAQRELGGLRVMEGEKVGRRSPGAAESSV
ncbi:Aegerolysin-domain-containing protein [Aspergillus pseudodeflectus]|uniref:Aegerolysin-domain-containing protein n=1 Tax=Aspergillus pseudodeflectus TaxID=176178 RepID=A0ABR4LBU0_9EURO